jgi:hypothetical protein
LLDFLRKGPLVTGNRNKGKNFGKQLAMPTIRNYVNGVCNLYMVLVSCSPSLRFRSNETKERILIRTLVEGVSSCS